MLFGEPPTDPELAVGAGLVQDGATANVANLLRSLSPTATKLPEDQILLLAEGPKWVKNGLVVWWYDHPEAPPSTVVDSVMDLTLPGIRRLIAPPRRRRP